MARPKFNETVDVLCLESTRAVHRAILKSSKTVREVHEELKNSDASLKYRGSVYKALERLVSAGLVEKMRDNQGGWYKSRYSSVSDDFLKEKLELREA